MNIAIKKTSHYYFLLVLLAIIFLLSQYPRIYGIDGFQVIWMANAIRDGALFSENTWLIHPSSYFGYYPFSWYPIGVPIFLAFLISLLNFFSFGLLGITEAILVFNVILIIIIYKCSRNLGIKLFKEEWIRFIFTAAILFSPYVTRETAMYVSTRIILMITMISLLNINLKLLTNNNINKIKAFMYLSLLLLVGALAHRLWMVTVITIIFMIFTIFIRKFKNLLKISVLLILPLSIIAFFVGLIIFPDEWILRETFVINQISFLDENSLLGRITLISIYYISTLGLISLFLPIGVIITLFKLACLLKTSNKKKTQLNNTHQQFVNKNYYLLLYIIPFLFISIYITYSIVIFFPILVIFSVKGLVYIKNIISRFSKKSYWVLPIIFLVLFIGYSIINFQNILKIDLLNVFSFLLFALILFLFVFVIINYNNLNFSNASFNLLKLKKEVWTITLIILILVFTKTSMEITIHNRTSSPYPWENKYLTDEEIEIIEYFQNEEINGLIFVSDSDISQRIGGVGFLPTFSDRVVIGISLYYGFISPNEVHKNTEFSLSELSTFQLFKSNLRSRKYDPIRHIRDEIIKLNITIPEDRIILRSEYNVQYIISVNDLFSHHGNLWILIRSLHQLELEPVFSTQHLLVWKIN